MPLVRESQRARSSTRWPAPLQSKAPSRRPSSRRAPRRRLEEHVLPRFRGPQRLLRAVLDEAVTMRPNRLSRSGSQVGWAAECELALRVLDFLDDEPTSRLCLAEAWPRASGAHRRPSCWRPPRA